MSKQNEAKARHQQDVLNRVIAECFHDSSIFCSDEESIVQSNVFLYGFRYNAGQIPELKDEFEDLRPIVSLLRNAVNNDAKTGQTQFPDWTCTNGLIEHFQVTASKDNEKGGQYAKVIHTKHMRALNERIASDEEKGILQDHYLEDYNMPIQTFENFVASFKKHWECHIKKLENYNGNKDSVCFLIESDCFGLKQELDIKCQYELGVLTGRIVEHYMDNRTEQFPSIMLGRCKELLEYIYKDHDKVHYVLLVSPSSIELIKTDKAKYIAGLLKKYKYSSTTITQRYITASKK